MSRTFATVTLAPPHDSSQHSLKSSHYKRLLPSQIVRIAHEAEIIVVVPRVTKHTPPELKEDITYASDRFDRVVMSTHTRLPADQKKEELVRVRRTHECARDGGVVHEYRCRVKNYPERGTLSSTCLTYADVRLMFKGDVGINVEVCGYPQNEKVLLKLKHIHALEIYQISPRDAQLNDGLRFESNGDIDEPLLRQLWFVKGCTTSTIELMMKYYQESSKRLKKQVSNMKSRKRKRKAKEAEGVEGPESNSSDLINLMEHELSEKRIGAYAKWVDDQYHDCFRQQYSSFERLDNHLIPSSVVWEQYRRFKENFPLAHAMFSIMVSTSRKSIELAASLGIHNPFERPFQTTQAAEKEDSESEVESSDETNTQLSDEAQHDVSQLERTILEYFLSFVRLKSQKNLRWWSMLSPFGYYSKGFLQPGK